MKKALVKISLSIFFAIIFCSFYQTTFAQNNLKSDIVIIVQQSNFNKSTTLKNDYKTKNPFQFLLNQLLTLYQNHISIQIKASCLYEPSCSRFSRKALSEFGVIKGVLLTADRLTRCSNGGMIGVEDVRYLKSGKIADDPCFYHFHKQKQ